MKIASIDIGSNTILMQIAEKSESGKIKIIRDEHGIARLGAGINNTGKINEDAICRAEEILKRFYHICETENVDKIIPVGTSALRESKNSKEVILRLQKCINKPEYVFVPENYIIILSQEEEAMLSYVGAVESFDKNNDETSIVIDIGGGSTEITFVKKTGIINIWTLGLGVVKLKDELGVKNEQPFSSETVSEVRNNILNRRKHSKKLICDIHRNVKIIAASGTPTALAGIALGVNEFDSNLIHKYHFEPTTFDNTANKVFDATIDELINNYGIEPGRADVLSVGTILLKTI